MSALENALRLGTWVSDSGRPLARNCKKIERENKTTDLSDCYEFMDLKYSKD